MSAGRFENMATKHRKYKGRKSSSSKLFTFLTVSSFSRHQNAVTHWKKMRIRRLQILSPILCGGDDASLAVVQERLGPEFVQPGGVAHATWKRV
jgi:hypothetical protein